MKKESNIPLGGTIILLTLFFVKDTLAPKNGAQKERAPSYLASVRLKTNPKKIYSIVQKRHKTNSE